MSRTINKSVASFGIITLNYNTHVDLTLTLLFLYSDADSYCDDLDLVLSKIADRTSMDSFQIALRSIYMWSMTAMLMNKMYLGPFYSSLNGKRKIIIK